jgi:hypothetical protein
MKANALLATAARSAGARSWAFVQPTLRFVEVALLYVAMADIRLDPETEHRQASRPRAFARAVIVKRSA